MKKSRKMAVSVGRDDAHVTRNVIEQTILNVKHFAENNKLAVVRVLGVFFLFFIIIAIFFGLAKFSASSGQELLYLAKKKMNSSKEEESAEKKKADLAESIDLLNTLGGSIFYWFSSASDLASYELGHAYNIKGDYEQAVASFSKFIEDNEKNSLWSNAVLMKAHCLEMLEKNDDALIQYNAIVDRKEDGYANVEALYHSARMQEKIGNLVEARSAYEKIISQNSGLDFYFADLAKKRLYLLGQKL